MPHSNGAELYRLHAAQCVEISHKAPDSETKLGLLNMAHAWLVLAEQADRNSDVPTLVYETPEQPQRVVQQQQQRQQPQPDKPEKKE
jgi:hypothetical protein